MAADSNDNSPLDPPCLWVKLRLHLAHELCDLICLPLLSWSASPSSFILYCCQIQAFLAREMIDAVFHLVSVLNALPFLNNIYPCFGINLHAPVRQRGSLSLSTPDMNYILLLLLPQQ